MAKDYKYIRAWGRMLGSYPEYIERQVERARDDKAPEDAIYEGSGVNRGQWRCFSDIENEDSIERMKILVKEFE